MARICDHEYRSGNPVWIPSGKSIGEIQDEVIKKIKEKDRLSRTYGDGGFTRTFSVHDVVPIFYPGMADYELYVDIRIDDEQGRNIGLQQKIYLGSYVGDKEIRETVKNGVHYYNETHREISDLLMKNVNKS